MEWLRSCFRSKWRTIRGSDRLRDGFYYFSPEGTPHYPGRHNLWSRDWTSDDRDVEPLLGEWKGARQWHRGDPPLRRPLPVLVGKPDCIEFGERPDLVRIPDVSAACAPVLPEACYAAEDTLRFKTNVTDCVFAQVSAKIIAAAYDDLAAAEILAFEFLGPDSIIRSFPQPSETLLAGVIGIVGDTAILWLTGTTTNWQLAVQGFYFGYGPVNQGFYSCSVLYEQAALATAAEIVTAGAGEATRIVLTGHSYGGAAAQVLAARMIVANPDREVELLTLGAPSAGDARLYRLIEHLPQTHWVNEFDPIPFLPPNNTRFVDLLGFAALPLRLLWANYVRPPFSRVITEDGQIVEMSRADLPDSSIVKLVLRIIAGRDIPYIGAHNLTWYIYRLCQACKCIPRPCVEPDPEPPIERLRVTITGLELFDVGTVGPRSWETILAGNPGFVERFTNEVGEPLGVVLIYSDPNELEQEGQFVSTVIPYPDGSTGFLLVNLPWNWSWGIPILNPYAEFDFSPVVYLESIIFDPIPLP